MRDVARVTLALCHECVVVSGVVEVHEVVVRPCRQARAVGGVSDVVNALQRMLRASKGSRQPGTERQQSISLSISLCWETLQKATSPGILIGSYLSYPLRAAAVAKRPPSGGACSSREPPCLSRHLVRHQCLPEICRREHEDRTLGAPDGHVEPVGGEVDTRGRHTNADFGEELTLAGVPDGHHAALAGRGELVGLFGEEGDAVEIAGVAVNERHRLVAVGAHDLNDVTAGGPDEEVAREGVGVEGADSGRLCAAGLLEGSCLR